MPTWKADLERSAGRAFGPATLTIVGGFFAWEAYQACQGHQPARASAYLFCAGVIAAFVAWLVLQPKKQPYAPHFNVLYEIPRDPVGKFDFATLAISVVALAGADWKNGAGYVQYLLVLFSLALVYSALEAPYGSRRLVVLLAAAVGGTIYAAALAHAFVFPIAAVIIGLAAASFVPFAWPAARSRNNVFMAIAASIFGVCFAYALQPFAWTSVNAVCILISIAAALAIGRPNPSQTLRDRLARVAPAGVAFSRTPERDDVYYLGPVETALDLGVATEYELARRVNEPNSIAAVVGELKDTGVGLRCVVRDPDVLLARLDANV